MFIGGVSRKGTRTAKVGGKNIDIPENMKYADYEKVYVKKEMTLEDWRKNNSHATENKVLTNIESSGKLRNEIDSPRGKNTLQINEINGNMFSGAFAGALNPDSERATEHAFLYYESVRHMKTDCKRISANTGFREQDIQQIKNHVFINEHELYDGEVERFFPSYHMAQSWQRLIDGREIQERDIVLLNHEFLESVLVQNGFNQQDAHTIAESIYNYSELIE